jgi:hypothetical protein
MRSAVPRSVNVAAVDLYLGTDAILRAVSSTSTWQHFDLDVTAPPLDVVVGLQFRFGGTAVDTWIDDVHFTDTGLALYRRDFQNGIVLVNPTFSPMTANLDVPCRRILGTRDPLTNDGSSATQVTVAPDDALFLLRSSLFVDAGDGGAGALPRVLAWRALSPNPLPRGGSAVARFVLPHPARVDVGVFDLAGRCVRSLGARTVPAGENTVAWDGRNDAGARLPRGLYFLRVAGGGEAVARKVVLE